MSFATFLRTSFLTERPWTTTFESQFIIKGFSEPCGLNHAVNGGGILLYVKEDIPCKYIKGITVSNSF